MKNYVDKCFSRDFKRNRLLKGISLLSFLLLINTSLVLAGEKSTSSTAEAQQQARKITGKVVDAQGESLPGVSVVVKGTSTGTVTNTDGNFTLDVPATAKALAFTFIGMKPMEVALTGQSTVNVTMTTETVGIEEVIAIGYSTTSKKNVASAISKVTEKEIVGLSVSDTRQTLQGKMAGVQVTNNSGDPGSGARIIIRGMGSFSNPDPLYVIDGIQGGDINAIQPQDI